MAHAAEIARSCVPLEIWWSRTDLIVVDPALQSGLLYARIAAFDELHVTWGERYPAIIKLWQNAWAEFVPLLAYSPEIRKVIYSTNAIESVHACFRRAVRPRSVSKGLCR